MELYYPSGKGRISLITLTCSRPLIPACGLAGRGNGEGRDVGLLQKQYEELRKKVKKSELENQRRAFKETRTRQTQNLPLLDDFGKIKER